MSKPLTMIFVLIILLFSQQSLGHDTGNGVDIFVYHGQRFNQNSNYHHIPEYDQYLYTMPESGSYSQNSFTNFQHESTYQQPLQYNQPSQYRPTSSNRPSFYYSAPPKYEHPYYHHNHHHHQYHHRPPPSHFNTPYHHHFGSWPSNVPSNANNINTGCNSILTIPNQQIPTQSIPNPETPTKLPDQNPTFQPFPPPPSATLFPNVGLQDKQPATSPSLNSSSTPLETLPDDINDLISAVFPNIAQQGQHTKHPQNSPPPITPEVPIPVFQPVPIIPTSPDQQQETTSTTPIPVFQPNPITPETATKDSPISEVDDKTEQTFDIDIRHGFIDVK